MSEERADIMRDKIRQHLKQIKMSQKAFADEINCSQTTFQRFMSGTMQSGSFAYSKAQTYFRKRGI
jgi:predicted XRE-type DNA-binding protein